MVSGVTICSQGILVLAAGLWRKLLRNSVGLELSLMGLNEQAHLFCCQQKIVSVGIRCSWPFPEESKAPEMWLGSVMLMEISPSPLTTEVLPWAGSFLFLRAHLASKSSPFPYSKSHR